MIVLDNLLGAPESSMSVQRFGATRKAPGNELTASHGCPVMAFQAMISGKYKIRILWDLKDGPRRYSEIRTGLLSGAGGTKEIAPRVLSRELKALAEAGMIARKDYGLVPPKVEYSLHGGRRRLRADHRGNSQMGRGPSLPPAVDPRGQATAKAVSLLGSRS